MSIHNIDFSEVLNEPLKFEKAIEYFKDKLPVSSKEFYKISDEYKSKAFTISGYTSIQMLKKFQNELLKALENGTTMKEFKKNMNNFLDQRGYEGLSNFQADNIFRTNIQTAYNIGHYKQMTSPEVLKSRPYWMYDAVVDRNTRPTHSALNGKVYKADNEFWDKWYPPNGYRCRCSVRTLSARQVEARGLKVETETPKLVEPKRWDKKQQKWIKGLAVPLNPDKGFGVNPAKNAFNPDLSKYPKSLKSAYEKRNEGKK
jgi:SPP1 gp7 family putative phage head morphogenesis protein